MRAYFFAILVFSFSCLGNSEAAIERFQSSRLSIDQFEEKNQAADNGFKKISAEQVPTINLEGDLANLRLAAERQLEQCLRGDQASTWNIAGKSVPLSRWCTRSQRKLIEIAKSANSMADAHGQMKTAFNWYQSVGKDGAGLVQFTGYYLPHLDAQFEASDEFYYPIYSRPKDLVQIVEEGRSVWRRRLPNGSHVPYYDRRTIDVDGVLKNQNLEIGWVSDDVRAFFTQIQGSGVLNVRNAATGGSDRHLINFSAANGQPYVSIGGLLKGEGKEPRYYGSLQGLYQYFLDFPGDKDRVLFSNPSYVFFELSQVGPFGTANTVLVPGHSIAVDRRYFPMGMVGMIQTQRPEWNPGRAPEVWHEMSRLVVTQDTGGAIRTPGRVDVYWGEDDYAEYAAGYSNQTGTLYFAVVK